MQQPSAQLELAEHPDLAKRGLGHAPCVARQVCHVCTSLVQLSKLVLQANAKLLVTSLMAQQLGIMNTSLSRAWLGEGVHAVIEGSHFGSHMHQHCCRTGAECRHVGLGQCRCSWSTCSAAALPS